MQRGGALASMVHNVSPERSAEPERSRTPGRNPDTGGSDREGEAQSSGETRYSLAGVNVNWFESEGLGGRGSLIASGDGVLTALREN